MHALLADGQDPRMGAHSETTIDRRRWKIGLTFVRILSCNRSCETASRVIRAINSRYSLDIDKYHHLTISSALLSMIFHFISLGICAAALARQPYRRSTRAVSVFYDTPLRGRFVLTLKNRLQRNPNLEEHNHRPSQANVKPSSVNDGFGPA
jgi:hypothetical protein